MYQTSTRPARKTAARTVKKYLAASIGSMFVRPHSNYSQRSGFEAAPLTRYIANCKPARQIHPKGLMSGAVSLMATSVICASIVMSEPVYAGWFQDFFDENSHNSTAGSRFHAGNMTGYMGGSVTMRMKRQLILPPIQFSPPRLSVGCNGIDIYAGSFSFIDKDEFIETLRNSGQQALAGLFLGAVKAMSPLIGSIIEYLQGIINAINAFNRDACGVGEQLGSALANNIPKLWGNESFAQGMSEDFNQGWKNNLTQIGNAFTNWEKIENEWDRLGVSQTRDIQLKDLVEGKCLVGSCNFLWYALAKKYYGHSRGRSFADFQKEAESIMQFVGVFAEIHKAPSSDHVDKDNETKAPMLTAKLISGVNSQDLLPQFKLTCHNEICTVMDYNEVVPDQKINFRGEYLNIYTKLVEGVRDRNRQVQFTDVQQEMLGATNIPLWRLATLEATPGVFNTIAYENKEPFIHAAAVDGAINVTLSKLDYAYSAIKAAEAKFVKDNEKTEDSKKQAQLQVDFLVRNINTQRRAIDTFIFESMQKVKKPHEMIEAINKAEHLVMSSINIAMGQNMRFASGRH